MERKKREIESYRTASDAGKKPIEKTVRRGDEEQRPSPKPAGKPTGVSPDLITKGGYRKAAKFLLLLGKNDAAAVLKLLPENDIQGILGEIASIRSVNKLEAETILDEFGVLLKKRPEITGGTETAREMLINAFGQDKGEELFKRAVPDSGEKPFQFLNEFDSHQILTLLKKESPYVIGIVVPFLDPAKASQIIEELDIETRRMVVMRIAHMKRVHPDAIAAVEENLRKKLLSQGKIETEEVDGASALAGILRHMDLTQGEKILKEISEVDPEIEQTIKEKLYTIEIVFDIRDLDLVKIARDFSDNELAVILKGKDKKVKERFFQSVSERRRLMVLDEMDALGTMRRSDVDKATKAFLDYIRHLEERGEIVISKEGEEYV